MSNKPLFIAVMWKLRHLYIKGIRIDLVEKLNCFIKYYTQNLEPREKIKKFILIFNIFQEFLHLKFYLVNF